MQELGGTVTTLVHNTKYTERRATAQEAQPAT